MHLDRAVMSALKQADGALTRTEADRFSRNFKQLRERHADAGPAQVVSVHVALFTIPVWSNGPLTDRIVAVLECCEQTAAAAGASLCPTYCAVQSYL